MKTEPNEVEMNEEVVSVAELMAEIDDKINLFISLTSPKGKAVKQRWRAIKKQRIIKDV